MLLLKVTLLIISFFCLLSIFSFFIFRYFSKLILFLVYNKVQDHFQKIADNCFEVVYRSNLYSYVADAQVPSDEVIETLSKDFTNYFFRLAGKQNISKFILYYGTQETLIENLVISFRIRLQDSVINKIMDNQNQQEQ